MKQGLLLLLICMLLASCCTVFTGSKQAVTFMAPDGTKIYDALTNTKIAEVRKDNTVTTYIRKRRDDKQLIAKREGCKPVPFMLETSFNASTLWNILFWPGFIVDFGTARMFKWEDTIVEIEMTSVE